ncbi:MAG: bifunctional YncE family protein/alkaline phosphatase family protein [bacterium]|nr:bifunctional YncE family protein/alkaline phosphatase family protein [bacterium]
MKIRGPLAAALAAVLLAAAPRQPLLVYSAPAGVRPAGANALHRTDAVLPDGRIAAPVGVATFVGTNPLGVALSPDGRYAIVSNDEQLTNPPSAAPSPELAAGYSLAVVDTRTMRVASVYHADDAAFFVGVAAVRDPANPAQTLVLASDGPNGRVRVFDLADDGTLTPEPAVLAVGGFPATIDIAPNGRIAYVANNLGNRVTAIDLTTRRVLHATAVGYAPFGVAVSADRAYVTNGGLATYATLERPRTAPTFANANADPDKSSSLSVVTLDASGDILSDPADASIVRMDPVPDGTTTIGGARPGALVVRRDGEYAYVALSNVDRIATVALRPTPRVISGLDIRLFVDAPYGTQPSSLVLSADGKRLYVALAGLNAVAVLDSHDPAQLHRTALIPTGAYPSALALSPDGRYLYVTSAHGVDGWGLLQRIDLKKTSLVKAALSALRYTRVAAAAKPNHIVPPLRSHDRSSVIDRVVYISMGVGTFDAFFGPTPQFDVPNLQSLAAHYALAENLYANDANLDANAQVAFGGAPTLYANQTLHVNGGRTGLDAHAQDPEEYPRAGYIFNALARANLTYRDYGALLNLSGYDPRASAPLGGVYTRDVPALAALDGHVDLSYPGWNPQVSDVARAAEFVSDMGKLVAADAQPTFTYVWLPSTGTPESTADADKALGQIVGYLSRTPHWSSTAIFVVGDGVSPSTVDHVNQSRSFALVVSPLAKPGYRGKAHLSVASVVKTEEELLGLDPLSLGDLLATDMAEFFGDVPYPTPYQSLP